MIMHQICLHHISSLRWRKNTQLLICPTTSFSLCHSLSPTLTFCLLLRLLLLSFFTSLSYSQICERNQTFLRWIPVVNKTINTETLLRIDLQEHHVHKQTHISSTPAQSNAVRCFSPAINTNKILPFVGNFV